MLLAYTLTHTRASSCRWVRGWRLKDKTFSVYYKKRDGEREKEKTRGQDKRCED